MNDRNQAVTKFCLAMEEHRRTDAGRVRTSAELVATFFPYDTESATDKLFRLMPNEVRGPVLSGWGIRGGKAALKDDDAKVQNVIHDALVAGDIDDGAFEQGVTAQILVDWVTLPDWWAFWRSGKLSGVAIQKALATARELSLIDDRWFLATIEGRAGKLKGTDVVCDALTKDQVVAWMRKLHASGDGSPAGVVAAVGWDTILTKTSQDALLFTLDAFAKKVGLVPGTNGDPKIAMKPATTVEPPDGATDPPDPMSSQPHDSGVPVSIPDTPAIEGGYGQDDPPSIPTAEQNLWAPGGESAKLVEAREKMMEMLSSGPDTPRPSSDVPSKPSSLEWPSPPEVQASKPPPLPNKGPTSTRR
jgi:hypothetical protein